MITPNPQGEWLLISEGFNPSEYSPIIYLIQIKYADTLIKGIVKPIFERIEGALIRQSGMDGINLHLNPNLALGFSYAWAEGIIENIEQLGELLQEDESIRVDYTPSEELDKHIHETTAICHTGSFVISVSDENLYSESNQLGYEQINQLVYN